MKIATLALAGGILAASAAFAAPAESPPPFLLQWGPWGSGPGQFRYPYGVATDSQGNVYIADKGNNRIQKFTSSREWGTFGFQPGQFDLPTGIAVSPDDLIYVCDEQGTRIEVFTSDGVFVNQWTILPSPEGVAVDRDGDVYVVVRNGDFVKKYTRDGTFILQWGSAGTGPGQFHSPVGIATDGFGNVYVADVANGRIQKFASDGTFLAMWPTGCFYLAADAAGRVYVTIDYANLVRIYSPTGTLLSEWGVYGAGGYGSFDHPSGIAVDAQGNIYVAESTENALNLNRALIQKFGEAPVPVAPTSWGRVKASYR